MSAQPGFPSLVQGINPSVISLHERTPLRRILSLLSKGDAIAGQSRNRRDAPARAQGARNPG